MSAKKAISVADLGKEYRLIRKQADPLLKRVLTSGSYVLGEQTDQFERQLSRYCGVRFAVGVNSGTDALLIALRALDIGPGDEVIVPAMTFIATAEAAALLGAKLVFADIDLETYGLDPLAVERRMTSRTKAIIAVHLYGQPAPLSGLQKIAQSRGIPLIEDMAQAIGAEYEGKKIGSFGQMACLSFYPTKNLGACGDGGAVLTSDEGLAQRVRRLRNHGAQIKYQHEEVGYNSRLDEIQAAILRVKLTYLDRWNSKRIELARRYAKALSGLPLVLPTCLPGTKHIYHLYSVRTPRRDALKGFLAQEKISTGLHYPMPLHLTPAFKSLGGRPGDYPNSEVLSRETLSLPLHPHMTVSDVDRVAQAVAAFFSRNPN